MYFHYSKNAKKKVFFSIFKMRKCTFFYNTSVVLIDEPFFFCHNNFIQKKKFELISLIEKIFVRKANFWNSYDRSFILFMTQVSIADEFIYPFNKCMDRSYDLDSII